MGDAEKEVDGGWTAETGNFDSAAPDPAIIPARAKAVRASQSSTLSATKARTARAKGTIRRETGADRASHGSVVGVSRTDGLASHKIHRSGERRKIPASRPRPHRPPILPVRR